MRRYVRKTQYGWFRMRVHFVRGLKVIRFTSDPYQKTDDAAVARIAEECERERKRLREAGYRVTFAKSISSAPTDQATSASAQPDQLLDTASERLAMQGS